SGGAVLHVRVSSAHRTIAAGDGEAPTRSAGARAAAMAGGTLRGPHRRAGTLHEGVACRPETHQEQQPALISSRKDRPDETYSALQTRGPVVACDRDPRHQRGLRFGPARSL